MLRALISAGHLAVGCLFLFSSLRKLQRPYDFLGTVYDYSIVGPMAGLVVASWLPWLELLISMCLIARVLGTGSLLLSSMLLACFTFVKASIVMRGMPVPCGCFGEVDRDPVTILSIAQTAVLLMITVGMLVHRCRSAASPDVVSESAEQI